MAYLSLSHISKSFGTQSVLQHVNLSVDKGEFLVVLGQSGSGKTTLLRLVAGFEKTDEGTITLNDRILSSINHHTPAEKRNMGIVFQDHALWPHMTVFDNVAFPLHVQKRSQKEINERVQNTLKDVNMAWAIHKYPHQLSGGEAQRVSLARTLIQEPSLIIFDEPLASLDAVLRHDIQNVIKSLHVQKKFTALYITHDQNEAMRLGHRLAILHKGGVEQCDTPQKLYHTPKNETVAMLTGNGSTLSLETVKKALHKTVIPHESAPILKAITQNSLLQDSFPPHTRLFFRPENVRMTLHDATPPLTYGKEDIVIHATVKECYFSHGLYHTTVILLDGKTIHGHATHFLESHTSVLCMIKGYTLFQD